MSTLSSGSLALETWDQFIAGGDEDSSMQDADRRRFESPEEFVANEDRLAKDQASAEDKKPEEAQEEEKPIDEQTP